MDIVGTVPTTLCNIPGLSHLDVTSSGNTGMPCSFSPSCLSTVTTLTALMCPSFQDEALCGFIAATDIASKSGYDEWACTTYGITTSNPCELNGMTWDGIGCSEGYVSLISIADQLYLTGL